MDSSKSAGGMGARGESSGVVSEVRARVWCDRYVEMAECAVASLLSDKSVPLDLFAGSRV
jgi:hypothetical protein